ncbi:HAD-superfamily hydrolase [Tritrichomonas foetus]|uniref:HAD-superfamily hydrolase n=1 Tax=Tritrichomonas foetus TaxID=1144522 RepID=A0A1J4JIC9_9EUKA|nr:HAD-superfamily hydrolase [Tritrichomonas foetus]|eukprot:OHS98449.1 HAD-superfamily hydrolase [Tritrichomonas foetus]
MSNIAALFDLDGVVIETEHQYTGFWAVIGSKYVPDRPDFKLDIKGMTLFQIYNKYFKDQIERQKQITEELNEFERKMTFNYIDGIVDFIKDIRKNGVKTAVVTSSNNEKMKSVFKAHPELHDYIDKFITADDVKASKPNPECYLVAAKALGADPQNCYVFEDSFNGLLAGRNAKMTVVGIATSNPPDTIKDKCDIVINDFVDFNFNKLISVKKSE